MTRGRTEVTVPDDDIVRQAISSIGGYVYQLYSTADAWLSLNGSDILLVEVAEDYAVVARNALKAVQVKRTSGSVTLRTSSVTDALNSFWRCQSANPDLVVQTVYLTTSSIGREKGVQFPKHMPGLLLWKDALDERTLLRPLRRFLSTLPLSEGLSAWLSSASDDEICDKLIGRIQWECGAPSFSQLEVRILERMKVRCEIFGILPSESRRVADAMILKLLKIAMSSGDRSLQRSQLSEIIERSTTYPVPAVKMREALGSDQYYPPLSLRQNEADDRLFFFAAKDRVPLLGRGSDLLSLQKWLSSNEKLSWTLVTGPGGSGKSRLALELCLFARASGWRAGFLYGGSEASKPSHFIKFRSSEPTLIVWDYVVEAPESARELIDTLISLHEMGALRKSVRVLLIERSRSAYGWWPRFAGDHPGRLKNYEGKSGAEGTFLDLKPLDQNTLWEIFEHVAGRGSNREEVLDGLVEIDPFGRPLFASLAADAVKHGRPVSKLSKQGLLNDILSREQHRWKVSLLQFSGHL